MNMIPSFNNSIRAFASRNSLLHKVVLCASAFPLFLCSVTSLWSNTTNEIMFMVSVYVYALPTKPLNSCSTRACPSTDVLKQVYTFPFFLCPLSSLRAPSINLTIRKNVTVSSRLLNHVADIKRENMRGSYLADAINYTCVDGWRVWRKGDSGVTTFTILRRACNRWGCRFMMLLL